MTLPVISELLAEARCLISALGNLLTHTHPLVSEREDVLHKMLQYSKEK